MRRVQARRQRPISVNEDGDEEIDEGGRAGTGLYASFQTIPYEAPPVVNRRVPKNAYGNLDVYVPSMVPRGGVHLPYPEAARAAKIIGADYADAVTGFEFKGRHGTAIIKGIVVAVEYRKALEEVIKGLRDEQAQAEEARRTLEALRMWRRFMAGLRVRERIDGYEIEGERDAVQVEMDEAVEEMEKNDDGGGFLPDIDQEEAEPTAGRFQLRQDLVFEDEAGGFMSENADEDPYAEEALRYTAASQELHRIDEAGPLPESDDEGGFIPDDEPHDGGGFLVGDEGGTMTTPPGGSMTRGDLGIGHGLADVELAEGIMLQRFYEEGNFLPSDNGGAGGFLAEELEQNTTEASRHMEKATTQARLDEEREEDKPMDTSVTIGEILQEHQSPQDAEEEGDDEGSLLSHDPEDEDADPAWLASDQE